MTGGDFDTGQADSPIAATDLEEILRNIHDGVYTLDPNGRITWMNEVAVEEFDGGYSYEDLLGAPVSMIMSEADIERCVELIADLVSNDPEGSRRCEIDLKTASGRTIPCDLHLALLPAEDGSFAGTLGVVRDITERKQRELRLSVLHRVLRHNLRNELTVISGRADLLSDDEEHAEAIREAVHRLLRTSEKARSLEDALTDVPRDPVPVDMGAVAADRCAVLERRFPDSDLRCSAASGAWVAADEQLEHVVDNLLENAVVHSDRERPTVELAVERSDDGSWTALEVVDDGPGIPLEEVEALGVDTETPLVHTSGLGLWLVAWLVESYDGEVAFERCSPRGTRVVVRLPSASPPDDAS